MGEIVVGEKIQGLQVALNRDCESSGCSYSFQSLRIQEAVDIPSSRFPRCSLVDVHLRHDPNPLRTSKRRSDAAVLRRVKDGRSEGIQSKATLFVRHYQLSDSTGMITFQNSLELCLSPLSSDQLLV